MPLSWWCGVRGMRVGTRLLNDRGDLLVCTCPVKEVGQEKVCAAISRFVH
jgi:hypothetical protein